MKVINDKNIYSTHKTSLLSLVKILEKKDEMGSANFVKAYIDLYESFFFHKPVIMHKSLSDPKVLALFIQSALNSSERIFKNINGLNANFILINPGVYLNIHQAGRELSFMFKILMKPHKDLGVDSRFLKIKVTPKEGIGLDKYQFKSKNGDFLTANSLNSLIKQILINNIKLSEEITTKIISEQTSIQCKNIFDSGSFADFTLIKNEFSKNNFEFSTSFKSIDEALKPLVEKFDIKARIYMSNYVFSSPFSNFKNRKLSPIEIISNGLSSSVNNLSFVVNDLLKLGSEFSLVDDLGVFITSDINPVQFQIVTEDRKIISISKVTVNEPYRFKYKPQGETKKIVKEDHNLISLIRFAQCELGGSCSIISKEDDAEEIPASIDAVEEEVSDDVPLSIQK